MGETDFTSIGIDFAIIALTIVAVLFCAGLLLGCLWVTRSVFPVWDGNLTEENQQVPRWWVLQFAAVLAFAVIYLFLYPAMGTAWRGWFGWTSESQYQQEKMEADKRFEASYGRYRNLSIVAVAEDELAMEAGARLFLSHCAPCHGIDARGQPGYPDLTDNNWLFGGEPETIKKTVLDGRASEMPAFEKTLDEKDIRDVVHNVKEKGNLAFDSIYAAWGEKIFARECASCHGTEGKGNKAIGAPNLTDEVWLFGNDEKTLIETVSKGRRSVMPGQRERLGTLRTHLLAAYVWRLSHQPAQTDPGEKGGAQ